MGCCCGAGLLRGIVLVQASQGQRKGWLGSEGGGEEEEGVSGAGGVDLGGEGVQDCLGGWFSKSPLKMSAAVVLAVFFLLLHILDLL